MGIIYIVCVVISLVCWIRVLIALFKKEGVGLGILGIFCAIYAFIWGWMKSTQLGLKTTMILWTIAVIGTMATGGFAAKALIDSPEYQKALQDAQRQPSAPAPVVTPEPAPAPAPQ